MSTGRISRRQFGGVALGGAVAASQFLSGQAAQSQTTQRGRPNVLFILADDMGYGDLSCYGRPDYTTPVLDNLAKEGVRFTDAYANAAVCTPTRTAWITGRYQHRLDVGLEQPLAATNMKVGLPPDHPTIGSLALASGYDTGLIGKWHLGNTPEFGPNRHGFNEYYGIIGGQADYFTHINSTGRMDLMHNLEPSRDEGYLTDLFTDHAIGFIKKKRQSPFFLSLQYNAPHDPWDGPEGKLNDHSSYPAHLGSLNTYGQIVRALDAGIGKVLKSLRDTGQERNTVVIFTSDNGGVQDSYLWPFSGRKGNLREGGIREPAMVRWPGVVPAGKVTNQVVTSFDWTATVLALMGGKPDPAYPFEGEDVMPVLTGARPVHDRTLFWRTTTQAAARMGNWKYLAEPAGPPGGGGGARDPDARREYLFDLAGDPGEATDLKAKYPDVFAKIKDEYQRWNSKMLANPKPGRPTE